MWASISENPVPLSVFLHCSKSCWEWIWESWEVFFRASNLVLICHSLLNISLDFVSPNVKLHNLYCHSLADTTGYYLFGTTEIRNNWCQRLNKKKLENGQKKFGHNVHIHSLGKIPLEGQWTIHTIHGKMGDEMKVEKKQWKWQKILAPIFEQTAAERSRWTSSLRSAQIVTALISRVFPYDNLFTNLFATK